MVGKEPEFGTVARQVAANVSRHRKSQNMNYTQLSDRLRDRSGWFINPVGIRRIEDLERRVTVDDLVFLADALDVTTADLLGIADDDMSAESRVDVTYVKRGQVAIISGLTCEPSQRAKEAIARAVSRRGTPS